MDGTKRHGFSRFHRHVSHRVLHFRPQMLIGMSASELSPKKAAATASGFAGWFSYIGAASAGYPLGKITQDYGWEGFFCDYGLSQPFVTFTASPLMDSQNQTCW